MLRIMRFAVFQTRNLPTGYVNSVSRCPLFVSRCPIDQFRCYSIPKQDIDTWIKRLDEAQQKRVKFIQNELALQSVENKPVPKLEMLTISDYEHILGLSQNQRHKYYTYLYKMHNSERMSFKKAEIRRQVKKEKEVSLQETDQFPNQSQNNTKRIEYGLGKGALLPKIYNRTIDKWRNTRALWRVALNAPKLIFDCSYSQEMTFRENSEAAKQLAYCFSLNRKHRDPFTLHYCGIDRTSRLWEVLYKTIPTLGHKPLPIQLHDEQIHEIFPKEKLVILTPDSPNILQKYNSDDYYVISSIVDRGDKIPVSLAKAKQLNLRHARLPMDQYRKCRINKTLTLDQILNVMLEIKFTGDWNKAFQYVAARKFY